jgi:beta-glucosidase
MVSDVANSDNFLGDFKMKLFILLILCTVWLVGCVDLPPYMNPDLDVESRVEDLVSRMTAEEKISQMSHLAPGIERLGVIPYEPNFDNPLMTDGHPDYSQEELDSEKDQRGWENYEHWDVGACLDGGWWNEALHGVARAGLATSFPQSIALGSTWNPELVQKMMDVSSTEARIHNNVYGKKLTYWSPTINILRDPRWGRNEESYSEDPYLLSRMAVAFVKGFQGDHPKYLKAVATIKHFVANNSEYNRHNGSADVNERWLREYYLAAFKAAIMEGGAFSVMSAYNAINGVPASANPWLLEDVLRGEWGFKGYVVSDCGAVSDVVHQHKYETDPEKAVALTAKSGTDLECETCETEQFLYDKNLLNAYKKGYITDADLTKNVIRLFRARIKLGEFDPPEMVPFTKIPRSKLDYEEHRELALQAAREAMVLLKNEKNMLPLDKNSIKKVAVVGPNADIVELGGYSGSPSVKISPLDGLKQKLAGKAEVVFSKGCSISGFEEIGWDEEKDQPILKKLDETKMIKEATDIAATADVAILVVGTNLSVANEAADRNDLELPGNQLALIKAIHKANPKTVVVLVNGMALTINWVDKNIPAILEAWYAGQAQGAAIADVLFGDYNPAGRLPVTFHKSVEDLPPMGDYDITKGRTYMFNINEVLYPFGYGLSYSTFEYKNLSVNKNMIDSDAKIELVVSVDVQNTSNLKGDEVVQLYIKDVESSVVQPIKKLKKFKRISINKSDITTVTFKLGNEDFSYWDENKKDWTIENGEFELQVGSSSADIKLTKAIMAK